MSYTEIWRHKNMANRHYHHFQMNDESFFVILRLKSRHSKSRKNKEVKQTFYKTIFDGVSGIVMYAPAPLPRADEMRNSFSLSWKDSAPLFFNFQNHNTSDDYA